MSSGPDRLPAGGTERPGEPKEGPRQEDQNAGVRAEAREVSVFQPAAGSAHTSTSSALVFSLCT